MVCNSNSGSISFAGQIKGPNPPHEESGPVDEEKDYLWFKIFLPLARSTY
jgi:hypothetical protein